MTKANSNKRRRAGGNLEDDLRVHGTNNLNGINGKNTVKKSAYGLQTATDSLDLEDMVSLALESDLSDLSHEVGLSSFSRLFCLNVRLIGRAVTESE